MIILIMAIRLTEIRELLQEEDLEEVVNILEKEKIIHRWKEVDGGTYSLTVTRNIFDTNCVGVIIKAEDSIGRYEQIIRYPTSIDSLYDSCIDAVKDLRKRSIS
jgi:hypothetical protein